MIVPVAFVLPSFAGGGAERVVITLANHLPTNRFAVTLILLQAVGPLRNLVAPHVGIVDLGCPRVRSARGALVRAICKAAPAIVLSTMAHLNIGLLSIRHRLPAGTRIAVREANDPAATLRRSALPWLYRLLYRRYYPRADLVVSPTYLIQQALVAIIGLPPNRLAVMRNPVDVDALREKAMPLRREGGEGIRYVATGRLTEQKGFDRLLTMMTSAPASAHLTILGDGPLDRPLREQADQLGLADRVRFAGFAENPWQHIAAADAFLLPSRWEGLPNAALEALACGTPVIATPEAGGITEIADLAAAGAVTVAPAGPAFVAAMNSVQAMPVATVRPSLLPEPFLLDVIAGEFTRLLDKLRINDPGSAVAARQGRLV